MSGSLSAGDRQRLANSKQYAVRTAELFSHLEAPFKQRGIVRASIKEVEYGMCLGLSVEWILRHKAYKSEGAQQRIKYLGTASTSGHGLSSLHAQMSYNSTAAEAWDTGQPNGINAAFKQCGAKMTVGGVTIVNNVFQAEDAAMAALFSHTSGVHNYYIILLRYNDGGDLHATAGYRSSGKLFGIGAHFYYFDPNFGEFKIGASASAIKELFQGIAVAYMGYTDKEGARAPKKLTQIVIDRIAVV